MFLHLFLLLLMDFLGWFEALLRDIGEMVFRYVLFIKNKLKTGKLTGLYSKHSNNWQNHSLCDFHVSRLALFAESHTLCLSGRVLSTKLYTWLRKDEIRIFSYQKSTEKTINVEKDNICTKWEQVNIFTDLIVCLESLCTYSQITGTGSWTSLSNITLIHYPKCCAFSLTTHIEG